MLARTTGPLWRYTLRLCAQLICLLILSLWLWPAQVARAATFTVTSTADSGAGSLRQAMLDANANPGVDLILFNLGAGVQTIQLASPLPTITDLVEINAIDGASCATFPLQPKIALDGSLAGANADGFQISASGSRIVGFYIHSFQSDGVEINAADVIVACNIIGLDPAGNIAGNSQYGVNINGNNNIIGNNGALLGNVISGNTQFGVTIENAVSGNIIRGNYIGTDATGTQDRGNLGAGVAIVSASNTTVGGSAAADRNVISGNDDQGVWFFLAGNGNRVLGNYIGLNAAGNGALPNSTEGVKIQETNDLTVGGTAAGEGNRIAFNNQNGVLVTTPSQNNRILGNQIFSNGQLGIDLSGSFAGDGITFNDSGDGDSGANARQNFPVIQEASQIDAGTIKLRGSLNSTANSSFRIEFFAGPTCDANGFGEGTTFLGSANLTTNGSGNGSFDIQLSQAVALGQKLTATATSNNGNAPGNTSEFSVCQTLVTQQPSSNAPQLLPDQATTAEDNAVTIDVLGNDISPNGNPMNIVSVGAPDFGAAQIVGNKILYTPPANFSGEVSFFYSVHNGNTANTRQSSVKVTVDPVNDAPTDILFSGSPIDQNTPVPANVGRINVVDVETNAFVFLSLVDTGQPNDNANFILFGSHLLLTSPLNFTNRTSISLGIRARDLGGAVLVKTVVIPLPVINHIPTRAHLSNDRVDENQPAGQTVGTLTAEDLNANDTHTFALGEGAGDTDNGAFRIEGNVLKTNAVLDFETKSVYSIRVRTTDNGGEFRFTIFSIRLNNLASPPDAPVNNLSFCSGDTISLIAKDSASASRRVFVTISSIVISDLTPRGCTVTGKMQVITNGNTVNNLPFSGKVNERNQFSNSTIPDFMLSIAGLPLRAGGVQILYTSERPSLHITKPALQMPKEFGGLSAEISVPTQIDTSGIRFGTGRINLPSITTSTGFELSLSGKLEPAGEGFKISADGTIGIPNIGKKSTGAAQACKISAGVTIFADANGHTVMAIAAGKDYPGAVSTTVFVNGLLDASATVNANAVSEPQAVDIVRLDAVRAGASCSPGLAIGTTGLFLTGLSGEITVTPGDERVDVEVTIEAGKELPGIGPILSIEGSMGLQPRPFKLDLGAAIHMLSIEVARANATITTKAFSAKLSFRTIGYFGSVSIAAFAKDGRPTFTGSGIISLGVEQHAVFFLVPPVDIVLASISADVGEFTNNNFGFKGNVNILGIVTVGFFIDHKGTFAFGDVSKFSLISAPEVAAARAAYLQALATGATVDATITSQYTFLDDGSGGNGGVIIRTPLVKPTLNAGEAGAAAVTDVITQVNLLQHGDVVFNLAAFGPITLTLITPDGQEVTAANYDQSGTLGYVIDYTETVSFQAADALEQFGAEESAVEEDSALPRLLFTPLDDSAAVNGVDLVIDGVTAYFDINFGTDTAWIKPVALTAGEHNVQLIKHGTSDVVRNTTITLEPDTDYSLLNIGGAAAGFTTLVDNHDEPATLGKAKVRFYNGAGSTLKLLVNGAPLFTAIGYQATSDYALVDAGSVIIELRDNGTDALVSQPTVIDLANGGVYTFFAAEHSADGFDIALVQRLDMLYKPTYVTYYAVDQAQMNEEWQMKLVGDTDNIPYEIAVWGPDSPPVLGSVTVDAANLAATEVSWQLTADIQPVTVTVYAKPGEISTSLVVTNTDDTTSTVEIPLFEGTPVGEFTITDPGELGGQLVTKQINLSALESGIYHLWIRADDGINSPVNAYAASASVKSGSVIQSVYGVNAVWVAKADFNPMASLAEAAPIIIDRETDFPTTWTATITTTFEPVTNALDVEWRANSHPDVDSYRLLFGHTPLSPTQTIEVGGGIAEFTENEAATPVAVGAFTLQDMMPGVPYFISIEAVDTESGKRVRSQEIEFIAVAGGFTLTSPQSSVKINRGATTTIPVTLEADEELFFPNVWLSTNLGDTAPGITARFLDDTDGDAQINANAPTRNLEISVDASVVDGRYPLVITGYNGNAQQALTVEIVVGEPTTGAYMPLITNP